MSLPSKKTQQSQALDRHREALARQARAAYAMGRQERLKILLNQQDPATVSRVAVYYDYPQSGARSEDAADRLMQRLADKAETLDEERNWRLHDEQARELAAMQRS